MQNNPEKNAAEQFVLCGNKKLRCGFTTGSAAAIGAKAAVIAVFSGKFPEYAKIATPKGWSAQAQIEPISLEKNKAVCAVKKDGGDDADETNGIKIICAVSVFPFESAENRIEIEIKGGSGIGTVTKAGLSVAVGEKAINPIPRKMIQSEIETEAEKQHFSGRIVAEISAENGEKIAKRTFNQNLGIIGGISILGTSGVVFPMSEDALVESIRLEMKVAAGESETVVITPGNFGEAFAKVRPELKNLPIVRCSNFVGKAIEFALESNVKKIVLVGHAGKFFKIAAGIWDTHSHKADCRMEIIAAHAALTAFDRMDKSDFARIFDCATVDAALDILDETDSAKIVCKSIIREAKRKIAKKLCGKIEFELLIFTNVRGLL